MASPAAVLSILVTANTAQATTALAKTDAQLKKTAASGTAASSSLAKFAPAARMAGTVAGGALAYGLYKTVKAGADFEKQMDGVGAVSNATGKEMKKLEKQALSLGQKTQFSAMEVASAQEALVKGGLKVKDVIGGALPAALSLAAAGELDLADAAATTVNAMKLFGLQAKDASSIADMLATAANKTTGDVEDFAIALKQGGAVAKLAGLNLNQTVVALEALAESGVKNSDAGTSMKTAFIQLLKPTERQAELAEQLNLTFVNQAGNMKSMAAISKDLAEATDGMTNAQRAATFATLAGTDGVRTLNALYAAGPAALRKYADANKENGTAQDIANKKMDNLAGSAEQLGGAIQSLAIKLSGLINPKLREYLDWLTGALIKLNKVGPGAAFGKEFVSAQEGLLEHIGEITDDTLYDVVAQWNAAGKTINKHQVTHWLALNKISAEQADRLFATIDRFSQNSKDAFGLLAAYMRGTVKNGIGVFARQSSGFLADWSHKGKDAIDRMMKALDSLRDGFDKTGDKVSGATDKMAEAGQKMAKSLNKTTMNVTGSFNNMVNATGSGLKIMSNNVTKALNAFGVKKAVGFSVEKVGGAAKGFQTGGVIVPGQGNGDKVPAMLEPGEVVWNKKAVAALGGASKANAINSQIPRFASGGVIEQALGPISMGPIAYDANHAGGNSHLHLDFFTKAQALSYGHKMQGMGWTIGEYTGGNPYGFGPVTTQHQSPGHYDGTAFDANTAADETKSEIAAVVRLLGGKGVAGAVAEKIARVLLKGPDGPLKDMGQSALDKVRDAANKFIASKAPAGEAGVGGKPLKGLPEALEKYNHTYPKSSGFGDGYAMPFNAVAALAEWAGAPGVSMARTAIGESQLEPGAVGYDSSTVPGASSIGYGLHMITSGVGNDDMINRYGGTGQLLNPVINSQAMNDIFQSSGYGAWYSDTKDTSNTHYNGPLLKQQGGIIQKLAKGGTALGQYSKKAWNAAKGFIPSDWDAPNVRGGKTPGHWGYWDPQKGLISVPGGMKTALLDPKDSRHDFAFANLLHEFAHTAQDFDLNRRTREGGADLWSRWVAPKVAKKMGEKFGHAGYGYPKFAKDVAEDHPANWWQGGHGISKDKTQFRQMGGIVQKFAGGGEAKKDKTLHAGFSGGPTDPAWKGYMEAQKMWEKLKELGGEDATGGHIAILLERIQIAEDLANADDFLSGQELDRQIGLHEKLYKDYKKADRMAGKGIDQTTLAMHKGKDPETRKKLRGLRSNFQNVKTQTSGITGRGGLVLSERLLLNSLKGQSATIGNNPALVEDLQTLLSQAMARYAVSQAQYGVFGAMADGGRARRTGPYLVGERGPEVVGLRAGAQVTPNEALGGVNVSVVMYEDRKTAMVDVNGREFEVAVQKVNRKQARSGGRVLPGRAGS